MTLINTSRIEWMQKQLACLEPTFLHINDDSYKHIGHEGAKNGAGHFTVEISSSHFNEKSLIESHRLVYQALSLAIPHEIHALKIKIRK
jgi:BolA family transcriptional regulator, general stress-responsive regulator